MVPLISQKMYFLHLSRKGALREEVERGYRRDASGEVLGRLWGSTAAAAVRLEGVFSRAVARHARGPARGVQEGLHPGQDELPRRPRIAVAGPRVSHLRDDDDPQVVVMMIPRWW